MEQGTGVAPERQKEYFRVAAVVKPREEKTKYINRCLYAAWNCVPEREIFLWMKTREECWFITTQRSRCTIMKNSFQAKQEFLLRAATLRGVQRPKRLFITLINPILILRRKRVSDSLPERNFSAHVIGFGQPAAAAISASHLTYQSIFFLQPFSFYNFTTFFHTLERWQSKKLKTFLRFVNSFFWSLEMLVCVSRYR